MVRGGTPPEIILAHAGPWNPAIRTGYWDIHEEKSAERSTNRSANKREIMGYKDQDCAFAL